MKPRALASLSVLVLAIAPAVSVGTSHAADQTESASAVVLRDPGSAVPVESAVPTEAVFLQQEYGLDPVQAAVQTQREVEVQELLDGVVKGAVKRAWAGAEIAHDDGGAVTLYVSSDRAVAALDAAGLPSYVKVERVEHSLDDLNRARRKVEREVVVANDASAVAGSFSSVIDVGENAIRYSAQEDSPVLTALQRAADTLADTDPELPATLVKDVPELDVEDAACPDSACGEYRGAIFLAGTRGSCTSAFTFIKDQVRYGSTAGHCGSSTWRNGGTPLGQSVDGQVVDSQRADYQIVRITNGWAATNRVWRPSNARFPITKKVGIPSNGLVGSTICHVGMGIRAVSNSAERCGTLSGLDGRAGGNIRNPAWANMGVATFAVCQGDSGGPVFSPGSNRAYGLTRGFAGASITASDGRLCSGQSSQTMFTWIGTVENLSGYTMATK